MSIRSSERRRQYQRLWRRIHYSKDRRVVEAAITELRTNFAEVQRLSPTEAKRRRVLRARNWNKSHREWARNWWRSRRLSIRLRVLEHYGGRPPKCECCGERHLAFLTIDHIRGGGSRDRDRNGYKYSGSRGYARLVREGFPKGFRVLCYNCNCAEQFAGGCPHRSMGRPGFEPESRRSKRRSLPD